MVLSNMLIPRYVISSEGMTITLPFFLYSGCAANRLAITDDADALLIFKSKWMAYTLLAWYRRAKRRGRRGTVATEICKKNAMLTCPGIRGRPEKDEGAEEEKEEVNN